MRKRTANLMVRLTKPEKARVEKEAKRSGFTVSEWVRLLLFSPRYDPATITTATASDPVVSAKLYTYKPAKPAGKRK